MMGEAMDGSGNGASRPSRPEGADAAYIAAPAEDTHLIALSADIGYWGAGPEEVQAVINGATSAEPRYNVVLVFTLPDRRALIGYAIVASAVTARDDVAEAARRLLPPSWTHVVRVSWIKASLTPYGDDIDHIMRAWRPLPPETGVGICTMLDDAHRRCLPRDIRAGDARPMTRGFGGPRTGPGGGMGRGGGGGFSGGYDNGPNMGRAGGPAPARGRGYAGYNTARGGVSGPGYSQPRPTAGTYQPQYQQPPTMATPYPSAAATYAQQPYPAQAYQPQPAAGYGAGGAQISPPVDASQFPSQEAYQAYMVQYQQYMQQALWYNAMQQQQQQQAQQQQMQQMMRYPGDAGVAAAGPVRDGW